MTHENRTFEDEYAAHIATQVEGLTYFDVATQVGNVFRSEDPDEISAEDSVSFQVANREDKSDTNFGSGTMIVNIYFRGTDSFDADGKADLVYNYVRNSLDDGSVALTNFHVQQQKPAGGPNHFATSSKNQLVYLLVVRVKYYRL